MCGIAGLIDHPAGWVEPEIVAGFSKSLEHRGPDDFGWLALEKGRLSVGREGFRGAAADAVLVHRRLSILDLTDAGWQPMLSADQRYAIVFNGEIYNYVELRRELEALGHSFHSSGDTEVLLRAIAVWGPAALKRLVGMFAFALLDTAQRRLFLARDFFGIKPLYYTFLPNRFAFASEMKTLLGMPGVGRRANPDAVYQYLRFGISSVAGGETLLADVCQLPPAHYLEVNLDAPQHSAPVRYWSLNLNETLDISFDDAAKQLRELFLDSVRLHLRSDVPVGTSLSGGIDSSAIAMAMRHWEPRHEIHAFSYIAPDEKISEERWIDLVGKQAGMTIHKVYLDPEQLVGELDRLSDVQDQPFLSTSILAQYRVFRRAHEAGIKVMLDGQGSDEMFGGYFPYISARLASLLRGGHLGKATQLMMHAARLPDWGLGLMLTRAGGHLLPRSLRELFRKLIGKSFMPGWLNAQWFQDRGVTMTDRESASGGPGLLRMALFETFTQRSLPDLLRYEDRNSMAFSIESRVPFLTPQLAEFAFRLPEEYLIDQRGTTKAVFRAAMRGLVPDVILDRKDKIGFTTRSEWLLQQVPLVESILHSERAAALPFLRADKMRQEWALARSHAGPCHLHVWRWLNFIVWSERVGLSY
jgi:asparagine synthase (glutamine-hydrolysing)